MPMLRPENRNGKSTKVPGIECVLTHEDCPDKRFTMAGQTYPEPSPYDRRILDDRVRFVGDAVAVIAGVSEKAVAKAMKLVKVDYEVLEPVLVSGKRKIMRSWCIRKKTGKLSVKLGRTIREISVPTMRHRKAT